MSSNDNAFFKDAGLPPPMPRKLNLDGFVLGLAVICVLTFFAGTVHRMNHRIGVEKSKMDIVGKYSSDVDKLRELTLAEVNGLNQLASRKTSPDEFANVYALLTEMVPDQSWLLSLTYQDEQVDLIGVTRDKAAISGCLMTLPWKTRMSFPEAGELNMPVPAGGSLFVATIDLGSRIRPALDSNGCPATPAAPPN